MGGQSGGPSALGKGTMTYGAPNGLTLSPPDIMHQAIGYQGKSIIYYNL